MSDQQNKSVPRSRGDEPRLIKRVSTLAECSPLARG